ncbi:NADPH:quinone reductase and related Zn-dependent oxidoreductase [Rubrobacter radiotolerans]|uniref:NADP-dependent oxidoreductase n=1 Tax=Rubrobacter radiotolerans TaxID=42256 RepID=A0A023X1A5_RUBRA|nr:NADP-dependent oxidoreductase [Rubrobacter radiotolerans]AHY46078.1 NADPH:quinone reductase and related Zn-dependent oxidoreductase [Rubrobacter radiotolerans]MDX5893488.1 NADP-dependent oxidoreductase [Rubrobacter radiotolerans]SMC03833.1 NADPH:quinone reductase [Rubrobacter radiotolerans DSM 5868]
MKAVAIEGFGGREVLRVVEMSVPEPEAGEVRVAVHAAGVGPWDVKTREGIFGGRKFPRVLGTEGAGVVDAVGAGVSDVEVGEAVIVYASGCYAEYVTAPADRLVPKPESLSFEEAAAVPVAGVTAYQALADELGVRAGETVLVAGATGGVGTFAVQLAKRLGARVVGTASARNHEYLTSLGADGAVDYSDPDWPERVREIVPDGVDAALDCVGGETFHRLFASVRDGGRVVSIAAFGESHDERGISHASFSARPTPERLGRLASYLREGKLHVEVSQVLPLEEAVRAHEIVERGHTRGKVVLKVR